MKVEAQEGDMVVTLTEPERAALCAVMAHTAPLQIVESAQAAGEPVELRLVQAVVMGLFTALMKDY